MSRRGGLHRLKVMRVNMPVLLGGSLALIAAASLGVSASVNAVNANANANANASAGVVAAGAPVRDTAPAPDLAAWRADTEAKLKAPEGWLSVAGLSFLKPGANRVGSDPQSEVVLPADAAPAKVGRILVEGEQAFFEPEPGADVKLKGQPVSARVELTGVVVKPGQPVTRLTIGRLTLHLHHSGPRLAVRLRDPEAKIRREFTGLKWFAPDAKWQLTGKFIPAGEPRDIVTQNVLGDEQHLRSPGEVEVNLGGTTVRLLAAEEEGKLWFIFSDATAPKETYRIRFLKAEKPVNGVVTLDFNRAYNPPCAYNPYTTCPLPPPQNKLAVRVPAGERAYH
jgi:uncharacterized protein (DUF1684 family)